MVPLTNSANSEGVTQRLPTLPKPLFELKCWFPSLRLRRATLFACTCHPAVPLIALSLSLSPSLRRFVRCLSLSPPLTLPEHGGTS